MIDRYIMNQIKKRGITLYDIQGGEYIDPDPENKGQMPHQRARENKFTRLLPDLRFCELLTEGKFDPYEPYKALAIPIKDLVRYWWNNIVEQELVLAEVFGDIMDHYMDRMMPEKDQDESVDLSEAISICCFDEV